MNIFDIIGPEMVGPSSSHTAGAVRIGNVARMLLGEKIKKASIHLHGSFADTGKGHGTDKAMVAGLMGFSPADVRIPGSFQVAEEWGIDFSIDNVNLGDIHPNSVKLELEGENGNTLEMIASSIGGGRISVEEIDGVQAEFSGEKPTLIVHNEDKPGMISDVTTTLGDKGINIATMHLYRSGRGVSAVMVIELDQEISEDTVEELESKEGIFKAIYLSLEREI